MNFSTNWRDRRTIFSPMHYSIANYSTETKNEMKATFGEDLFLNNLHLLHQDPLMKNLADTIITEEKMAPKSKLDNNIGVETKKNMPNLNQPDYSPLSGITNFFSGVMNVITNAMFSKRKQSDFGSENGGQMAVPAMWHGAKISDENKILQDENCLNDMGSEILVSEMTDCRKAAAHCQNKIEQVRILLGSKPVPCTFRARRRPKKVFVEASSVEDCFEDAFSPEDFENIANDSVIEYSSPVCYHDHVFHEIDSPRVKVETAESLKASEESPKAVPELRELPPVCESTEIIKNIPEVVTANDTKLNCETKKELVESCEDKINKLKALLQERKKKPKTIIEPEPISVPEIKESPKPKTVSKVKDKRFKNPNRTCCKRMKSKMKKNIQDDLLFANEINSEDLSSVENSPSMGSFEKFITTKPVNTEKEYFDEVSGRFHSTSVTDSEDSFQIVFNDSPKLRWASDCESEDSFIVFEDSPDSCYTSNDVFGDSSDSEDYDSDSDLSDSGCGNMSIKLAASLSKSVSNLTDDSLYVEDPEDEVDCANISKVTDVTRCESEPIVDVQSDTKTGLLIDEKKKLLRKDQPAKKVQFSQQPPKVHVMRVWAFAARQARAGHWERYALDRDRFKRRIADVDVAVSWVLKPQHRSRVMFQRFMPWWNAQKRKELAEKKEREAQEKLRREEEELQAVEAEKLKLEQDSREELEEVRKEIEDLEITKVGVDNNVVTTDVKEDNQILNTKTEPNNENTVKLNGELKSEEIVKNNNDICLEDIDIPKNLNTVCNQKPNDTDMFNLKDKNEIIDKNLCNKVQAVSLDGKILDIQKDFVGNSVLNT